MNFTLLGWNFRSTPLEVRDRISLTENEQLELVHHIKASCGIQESVLLSTCNRTELFLYNMERPEEELLEVLQNYWGIPELLQTHYLLRRKSSASPFPGCLKLGFNGGGRAADSRSVERGLRAFS